MHRSICAIQQHVCLLTSMLGKLGVGQDLFAELEPVSVLLVFVTSLSKEGQRNHIMPKEQEWYLRERQRRSIKLIVEFTALSNN